MSLTLRRVELTNIRSHSHVIFEPESDGITAIQGENGAGKSTIVDSLAWCLFGTKPSGVSKAMEIFKNGISDTDKAFARVDMVVDGRLMRFERRRVNKHGAIEVEVFTVEIDSHGVEKLTNVAGPAISHAENYIRKLLRMDEKGFLAAVLIQQKQVDQLISANPRERGQVIEKLTGIAGVTAALTESKQELNVLRKAAALSTIDEESLEKLRVEEAKLKKDSVGLKTSLEVLKNSASELKNSGVVVKEQLEAAVELFEHKDSLEKSINDLALKKTLKEEDLESTLEDKEKAKRELVNASGESLESLTELIKEKDTERGRLDLIRGKSEDRIELLTKRKKDKELRAKELKVFQGNIEELSEKLATKKTDRNKLNSELAGLRGNVQQLANATAVIEHGDSCPTCLQKVSDVSVATAALNAASEAVQIQIASTEELIEVNLTEANEIEELLKNLIEKESLEGELEELTNELKELKKTLDRAAGELRVSAKELKILREKADEARQEKQKKQAHQRLLDKAQQLTAEVENIDFQLGKLRKESSELGPASQREINGLQKKLDTIRGKHSSTSMEFTSKNGDLKLQLQKIEHMKKDIARHEEDIRKHKELVQSVAVASHTHEVVAEFREARIRNSIPVIEVYASDLLSRFTEGKFARLSLNQKFEATVYLADGTARAVGLLSGGELSAAAMALRLAISLLLNSDAGQNLMILDEVLVSQDTNRAEQILVTLKEVSKGQVILIAHNEAIDSIADKIVTLGARADS